MYITKEQIFSKNVMLYIFIGISFGSVFPVVSIYYTLNASLLPITLANIWQIKETQPLFWIIGTAPIFLGIFVAMLGLNQTVLHTRKNVNAKKYIILYTVYGILFGTLFPVLALHYALSNQKLAFNWSNSLSTLYEQPLLWIIMTAPFFLGLLAAIAGINKKQGEELKKLTEILKSNQVRLKSHAQSLREVAQYDEVINADLKSAFPRILKTIVRTLNAEQAGLWMIEEEEENSYLQCLAFCSDEYCIIGNHIKRASLNKADIFKHMTQVIKSNDIDNPVMKLLYQFEYNKHVVNRAFISVPVKDEKKIIGILSCATAGHERVWIEDETHYLEVMSNFISLLIIAKQKENAEEADRKKLAFLSVMGHELRTPLNIISGFTDLLINNIKDKKTKEYACEVQTATKKLSFLVNDLLQLCKLENQTVTLHESPFDLHKSLEKTCSIFQQKAKDKNIIFKIKIDNNVPEFIIGDEDHLKQIIINCLDNAIKFTKKGSINVNITLNKARQKTMGMIPISFNIIDTGIGIDKSYQSIIFEPFTQADSSISREYEGTGLGLSISRHMVELMKGEMSVKSVLGKGSTFVFCIPFKSYKIK